MHEQFWQTIAAVSWRAHVQIFLYNFIFTEFEVSGF